MICRGVFAKWTMLKENVIGVIAHDDIFHIIVIKSFELFIFAMYMSSSVLCCPSVQVFIWRLLIFEKIQIRKLMYISIWHIFTPSHIFGAKVFRLAMKVKLYMYRSIREILSFFATCSYVVWNYICIQNSIKFHFSYLSSSFEIFCNLIIMVVIIFKDLTFVSFSTSYVYDYMFQKIIICIVWGFAIIYSLIIKYWLIRLIIVPSEIIRKTLLIQILLQLKCRMTYISNIRISFWP